MTQDTTTVDVSINFYWYWHQYEQYSSHLKEVHEV